MSEEEVSNLAETEDVLDARAADADEEALGSGSGSDSEEDQVEWLATTREKRATAGNRMKNLLEAEEPDDELELLFAEADDDAGFSDHDGGSDVQMDSSSDEEDQGPVAGDEMEGEKELQRQVRAEAKKKKKKDLIPKIFKKQVRIDPTVTATSPTKPKKKKRDRESWLPVGEDLGPKRSSARATSKLQKQALHTVLVDREIKRKNQLIAMSAAAEQRAANAPPPMTQEDRLREAARVEKANAKSLYKWQENENAREEERKAKLARLHDRTLQGPVITFWSGMVEYYGGKLRKVGKVEIKEKPVKKRKADEMEPESEAITTPIPDAASSAPQETLKKPSSPTVSPDPLPLQQDSVKSHAKDKAATPPPPQINPPPPPPNSSILAPPAGFSLFAPPHIPFAPQQPSLDGSAPLPGLGYGHNYPPSYPQSQPYRSQPPYHAYPPIPRPPTPPPALEHTLRSSIILSNFDPDAISSKSTQTQILFGPGQTFTKASKSKRAVCAITGYPAKYRDPATGLPYCNTYAYREIQRLKRGDYKWSKLVGAYVGVGGGVVAARGVPARFRGLEEAK